MWQQQNSNTSNPVSFCLSFPLEMPLYGFCISISKLIFILNRCSTLMQNRHDITHCPWKERSMCVIGTLSCAYKLDPFENNIPQNTWMRMEFCRMELHILIFNTGYISRPSAEPEGWRCSTPHAQRTGSSMLWTGVWMGWGKAQQQLTTGMVRLSISNNVSALLQIRISGGISVGIKKYIFS